MSASSPPPAPLGRVDGASQVCGVQFAIGTYAKAGGAGLVSAILSPEGDWALGTADPSIRNASYGVYSPRFALHYLVDEQDEGAIGAYRKEGRKWQRFAQVPTLGAAPCYVALHPNAPWLAIANYGSGSIALFPLDPDSGCPRGPPALRRNQGHGPVTDRQDGPHAHCAIFSPDGAWLYHVDLGTDQVLAYAFDPADGSLGEATVAYRAPRGSGPRHLVFHPRRPIALLIGELGSTLTSLHVGAGKLSALDSSATRPAGYWGANLGGHLALNRAGDRVYVTNRGHDSIAVFALDEGGQLTALQHVASGGASPRFFQLLEDERRLVVANEQGETIAAFVVNANGLLAPLGEPFPIAGAAFVGAARDASPWSCQPEELQ